MALSKMAAFERFPHEVFKEVMFHSYVYTPELPGEANFPIEVLSPPVPASQVCRSWRYALLSDPTMWTCIVFPKMNSEWIMELLRRSGPSLLNVFLSIAQNMTAETIRSYDETSSLLSALFQQIHRFKILRMQVVVCTRGPIPPPSDSIEELAELALSKLQQPAPNLETLSFCYIYPDDELGLTSDYTVIRKLFLGDAPRLTRLHHSLTRRLEELNSPVFHNLTELRLALNFDLNFSRFLDLLELSPRLKHLLVYVEWEHTILAYLERPSDRKVHLPLLEKLVLQVNFRAELTDLILAHVTLPPSTQWRVVSPYESDIELSSSVSQILSRAHFTSLHIRAFPSSVWLTFQEKLDGNRTNCFVLYIWHENLLDLVNAWNSVVHAFKIASSITHMEIEFGSSGCFYFEIFPILFTPMSNLRSLIVRPDTGRLNDSGPDEIRFLCLTALLPNYQDILTKAFEKKGFARNIPDPRQWPEHHNQPGMSTGTDVWICPLLREVTIQLRDPFEMENAELLCAFSLMRRAAGTSPQILVCCPQTKQGVEERLTANSIKISLSPLTSV